MINKRDFIFGAIAGFLFFLIIYFFLGKTDLKTGETIDVIAIFGNALFALFIAYFIQNHVNNRKSLKDYFINEICIQKKLYSKFILDIRSGKKNSQEIKQEFKNFSVTFFQLNSFVTSEMQISIHFIQERNRDLQKLVTNSSAFNEQYDAPSVMLGPEDINELLDSYKNFNHFCTDAIVKLNKY